MPLKYLNYYLIGYSRLLLVALRWRFFQKRSVPIDFDCLISESPFLISLTSYTGRFDFLEITLKNLITQSKMKFPIIVNLYSVDYFNLPESLIMLENYGVSFRNCPDDFKVYLKFIPVMMTWPEKAVISIDDDVYYPNGWIEKLVDASLQYPGTIVGHRGSIVPESKNHNYGLYQHWPSVQTFLHSDNGLMLTGVGGVLYPPHVLPKLALDTASALKVAPGTDDLWLYAISEKFRVSRICLGMGVKDMLTWPGSQDQALWRKNVSQGRNDLNFNSIRAFLKI